MGPSPDFEIFISYAHIDNVSLVEGKDGWVSIFKRALETRFKQRFGYSPAIYLDIEALRGNDDFEKALIRRLPNIAALVCVLSERYIDSAWCLKELRHFSRDAEDTGGLLIDVKTRIFKVEKAPVPPENQFSELRKSLGYTFYYLDSDSKHPRQLNLEAADSTSKYVDKLDDLIDDVNQLLESMKRRGPEPPPSNPGAAIYLAETTLDLRDDRDRIKRELQRRGYVVLPDKQLPSYVPELETIVNEELQRCALSIHMIGENYGIVPEGKDKSIIAFQDELAAQLSRKNPSFARLIWIPPALELKDDRQRQFVNYLQNDLDAQQGAEVLQTKFEDFKTIILDKLKQQDEKKPVGPTNTRLIYLICDQPDLEAVEALEAYLEQQGYEVILPEFEGDEAHVRAEHRDCLQICDATIIFYGSANEFWVRTKLRDLKKIAGYGRNKPMLARAIYCAPPETPHKQRLLLQEALLSKTLIIGQYGSFSPASLDSFLADMRAIKSARGGRNS